MRPVVVTGFQPYGGRALNPAHEIMRAVDGKIIGGAKIVGRPLPVSFREIKAQVTNILDENRPSAVISVGLWPGEPIIRLERIGVNVADFEIADNDGSILKDTPISSNGAAARFATLPLRKIQRALLEAGIPARVSASAGTFLCNACLYSFLEAAEAYSPPFVCGFIHVPYLPEQVAQLFTRIQAEGRSEVDQRVELASMDLSTSVRAIEIAITETLLHEKARGGVSVS
jgi:pyroglutamyl-peptidase